MSLKKKILVIVLFIVSFLSIFGIIGSSYCLSTNYMVEMNEGVYLDTSEIRFNGDKVSLEENEEITSVTVTLVNKSNKTFEDKRVRLMYYNDKHSSVKPGETDFTYPEGYSLYNKIVDVKANSKTTVTFTDFRNTWFYDDELRVAFEYDRGLGYDEESEISWEQLDDGNDFESYHYNTLFLLGIVFSSVSFAACAGIATLVILKNRKTKKEN